MPVHELQRHLLLGWVMGAEEDVIILFSPNVIAFWKLSITLARRRRRAACTDPPQASHDEPQEEIVSSSHSSIEEEIW